MKIKSNDRMPARTPRAIEAFLQRIRTWQSPHRAHALAFAKRVGPRRLFELLHAIRRWYSGQTMARLIHAHRGVAQLAMDLSPRHAVGVYRGFKVPTDHRLAQAQPGQRVAIGVTRNHGFSSWTTNRAITNRFSGASRGKVGIVVQLASGQGIVPVLAPPARTRTWFNALYSHVIGDSYRPTEGEYLIRAPKFVARIIRVKR